MKPEQAKPTRSSAVGQRITALRYDAEAGYVVLELEGAELWLSADGDGYHLFVDEGAAQGGISRDAVEDL